MSTQTATQTDAKNIKNVENLKVVQPNVSEAKKEAIKAKLEKFRPEPMTAEERISRIPLLEELSKRFTLLKTKSDDLKMFTAGNDKTNAKIIFKNSQGFEFEIRNSNVIEKLTREAHAELNILLSEAKNEILNFEM